jgi:hypothetical protein
MSGLFRKVSRRAKISGLRGWAERIRTSKCRFLEAHGKVFEVMEEFLVGLERLRSRDFAAFQGANRAISDAQTLSAEVATNRIRVGSQIRKSVGNSVILKSVSCAGIRGERPTPSGRSSLVG